MSILICIPTSDNKINFDSMISLMNLKQILNENKINLTIISEVGSLIGRSRNNLFHKFIKNDEYDYLLFIDNDISGFEHSIIPLLKKNNKNNQILGITYAKKEINDEMLNYDIKNGINNPNRCTKFNLNTLSPPRKIDELLKEIKEKKGFLNVKHLPTGCLLIPKQTALKMVEKYPDKQYKEYGSEEIKYNLFDSSIYNNRLLSEDYAFSQLLLNIGGECVCDAITELKHHGNFIYTGSFIEFLLKKKYK